MAQREFILSAGGNCSFCGKHSAHIRALVETTGQAKICDECVALCSEIFRADQREQTDAVDPFHCTFCGAQRKDGVKLIAAPRMFICDECVGEATVFLRATQG